MKYVKLNLSDDGNLNESTKISFGATNSSSHYKYIYKDGYINYGRY